MPLDIRIAYPGKLGISPPILVTFQGICVVYIGKYVTFTGPSAEQVVVP